MGIERVTHQIRKGLQAGGPKLGNSQLALQKDLALSRANCRLPPRKLSNHTHDNYIRCLGPSGSLLQVRSTDS